MELIKKYLFAFQNSLLILGLFVSVSIHAQDARFTVVLDAGHGGHDPGARGTFSREKDINLAVTLDLGAIIEQDFKDVRVVYTRKTDKYLTLQERADVVNDHHADLFICVHTNASPSPAAYGAESYTLGLAKTKANLDVAMRENSVITLEENYKTKYQGFDPNSVDSYIMFEFMQDKYIDRSVDFASIIQKQFHSYCNRSDRGVRQAGFWVLHRSACPSVLVELGFISNPAEERYLTSALGQKEMATAVFNAFVDYKRAHDKKSGHQTSLVSKIEQKVKIEEQKQNPVVKTLEQPVQKTVLDISSKRLNDTLSKTDVKISPKQPVNDFSKRIADNQVKRAFNNPPKQIVDMARKPVADTVIKIVPTKSIPVVATIATNKLTFVPVFKIQLLASKKALKSNAPDFKGIKNIEYFSENGLNKYTVGAETNYQKIENLRKEILAKFPEAFIIAFVGDKKMTAKEAIKLTKN